MPAAAPADGLVTIAVLAASLAALFFAPGGVLLFAARVRLHAAEAPAYWFAASLALLTATFATCLALSTSIAAAPLVLAVLTAASAVAARLSLARGESADGGSFAAGPLAADDPPRPTSHLTTIAIVLLAIACAAAAVAFAPVGSVDRWWYLAYVRGWLEAPVLDLAEPFLGTGQSFARFGVHPWLFGIAAGSWLSGIDPVDVYELGAPVVVVLASISAAFALARELFRDAARVRLAVLATMLLWSGALLPVLARAGEDKILAASALLPLVLAAFLRALRDGARGVLLLAVAASATAAVHALDYAFALVVLLPSSALLALLRPALRRRIAAAVVVLGLVAIAPAVSGMVVRERLSEIGADLSEPDHPVVRVHEARERLVDLGPAGYVVEPRLLLHPLAVLALVGAAWIVRRRPTSTPFASEGASTLVAIATMAPLAIAFVPPLPATMGALVPPWMVYRVLWVLPLAPLAAVAASSLLQRLPRPEPWAAALLLALGLPIVTAGTTGRLSEARGRLAAPESEDFRSLVAALRALPPRALVAAPPALAERIPALSARHVVAALDRSTIVFAGSRSAGEARLRARAAILSHDAGAATRSREAGIEATHAVYDPRAAVRPSCARETFRAGRYALCALDRPDRDAPATAALKPAATPADGNSVVARGRCVPEGRALRVDAWSAAPPVVVCRFESTPELQHDEDELALRIAVRTGRATDELMVTVDAGPDRLHAATRVQGSAAATFAVPRVDPAALEVRVASSFLPMLRIERVELVATASAKGAPTTGSAETGE